MSRLFILVTLFLSFAVTMLPLQTSYAAGSFISDVKQFAEAGDGESQFALALLYEYGNEELGRDQKQSIIWFEKAGRANVAGACLYLGIKFENGNGVGQDYDKAACWYDCAARQDWPSAQFFLARLYREGKGVVQDHIIALAWLGLAAEHGYPGSEEQYEELLMAVESVDVNVLKEKQKSLLQGKRCCN